MDTAMNKNGEKWPLLSWENNWKEDCAKAAFEKVTESPIAALAFLEIR